MKEYVSKAELARIAGVAAPSITKAIANGRVIETAKGIDLHDPTNALFVEKHKAERASGAPKRGEKPAAGKAGRQSIFTQRVIADTELKREQAATHRQRRLERMGLLVLKSDVDKRLAVLGQEVKTRMLDMPARVFPQLSALIKSGREDEALRYLEAEVTEVLQRVVEKASA